MGRKIPGKKHRTIKDPYKQQQKRMESVRMKINNPPLNAEEQEIPKSLLKIMELKNQTKQKINKRIVRKTKRPVLLSLDKFLDKEPAVKGVNKPDEFIPNVVQKPNESVKHYLGRVSTMTQNLISEIEFEKKFGVEIKRNLKTGEITEIKNFRKKKIKSKKKNLAEKRKLKLKKKKENLINEYEYNPFREHIEFGEVVHRPPELTPLKNQKNSRQNQRYHDLLLKRTVETDSTKMKNLQTNLEREKTEYQRKFIVEAYRKVKKKRMD